MLSLEIEVENNIVKYLRRRSPLPHFSPALELSANMMQTTPFFFQIDVFGGKINGIALIMYLININARSSFTRLRIIRQIK